MKTFRIMIALICLAWVTTAVLAQRPYRANEEQVERLLDRIERQTDRFRDSLNDAIDDSPIDDTAREKRIERLLDQFEDAADDLRDRFDSDRSAEREVERLLDHASKVHGLMRERALSVEAQRDWSRLRASLRELGRAYNVTMGWDGEPQARRMSEENLKKLLSDIKEGSDELRDAIDDALDDSELDGTNAEDRINDFIEEFNEATEALEEEFDSNEAAQDEVEEVLIRARRIDEFLHNHRLSSDVQSRWNSLRRDLVELGGAYGVAWHLRH